MKQFWKTVKHPMTWQWLSGAISFSILFVFLSFWDQSSLSDFDIRAPLLYVTLGLVLIPYFNFQYITGAWSIERWRKMGYYLVNFPGSIVLAYCAVFSSKYVFISVSILYGSQMVAMGFLRKLEYYIMAFAFLISALAFLIWRQGMLSFDLPWFIALSVIVVQLSFAMAATSDIVRRQRIRIQQFLAGSRKDKRTIANERERSDNLLLNILPDKIASELKDKGKSDPEYFDSASVLFTDFKGFTAIAEKLTPIELVSELDSCFSIFDSIIETHGLEKLKTIGDSYMVAGGLPVRNSTHAIDCIFAALEIHRYMNRVKKEKLSKGLEYWELRLGIHSGPLVAGVIGHKKFAYDVWGDTVNTASRCESSGEAGRINISKNTYELVKDYFDCEYRGRISAKNKGDMEMYFVNGFSSRFASELSILTPNDSFDREYKILKGE